MPTQINQDNIQPSTLVELSGPTVTNIQITNSSYVVLDDTAVSISGGYIKITGTNFASGCEVIIGSTNATAVSFVSSTVLNVQVPALSAGTYVVYVVNSDGGVAIRVNGLTYSGTPTWVTGSTLTSGIVNEAISIQLSATGDAPLTYSLASGSSLPSGLTLTSGGLLSGTITGITVETIYNFTIDAIDAELQESPRSFSITIIVGDQYFPYVSSLLSATALTLPFNNDASTNNFAVTVVGDTRPNNFGPYTPGYYSNFFDGSGDYFTTSGANLQIGTNQFTLEAWIYPTAQNTFDGYVSSAGDAGAYTGISMSYDQCWIGSSSVVVSYAWSASIVLNKWNHIAITRDGSNTVRWFVNGTLLSTSTNITTNINSTNYAVGLRYPNYLGYYPTGYISNVRLIVGSAAYTASFAVPTTPFTAASGTQLLTCQSNRFIDSSTNNYTLTVAGNTLISGFDPFVPDTNYSTYGSTYFDGTGDSLTLASNTAFSLTTDFTVEFWVYTGVNGVQGIISTGNGGTVQPYFYLNGLVPTFLYNGINVATGPSITLNAWNHIAYSRSSSSIRVFTNGVAGSTASPYTDQFTNSGIWISGSNSGTQLYTGYISNLRIVKGTAVYTSAFTPPTTPLTAITNTSLLTLQTNQPANNNAFLDSSTNNFLVTRNGNTTQGSFSPHGPLWSNYFDGTGDYLATPNTVSNFGTGDFTIECWFYRTSTGTTIISNQDGGNTDNNYFVMNTFTAQATFQIRDNSSQAYAYGPATTTNTWTHLAITRSSGTVRVFVNGVSGTPVTITKSVTSRQTIVGGFLYTGFEGYFSGYISNLRVIKGTAVYTGNFTPTTSPLTAIANTSLLTCNENRLIDDSPNNFTITRTGDVSVQRFSPFSPQTVPTYYSGYFDGTGDYLSIPSNTAFAFGTGAYTVEAWIYLTAFDSFESIIFGSASANGGFGFAVYPTGRLGVAKYGTGNILQTNAGLINLNTWYHIAVSRSSTSSNSTYLFINGTLATTGTDAENWSVSSSPIIGGWSNLSTYDVTGYISNLRVIKGTAVYTANFTPSTSPLTAIANTSLLTCQSATFIDNSTNNFTITVNGNSTPRTVSPFTPTATSYVAYSPSTYSGSMYFDGSGDFLTIPSSGTSPFFNFNGTSWTIELFFYLTALPGGTSSGAGFIASQQGTNNWIPYIMIGANSSRNLVAQINAVQYTTSQTYNLNQWNHVALVRNAGVVKLYLNGVATSISVTVDIASVNLSFWIGKIDNAAGGGGYVQFITGYVSGVQIVRSALYTSSFVPPVSPLTAVQNSVLLLNGTSAGIYDMSMMNDYETVGNSTLVTNIEKYGNSSLYFDGTGDYLRLSSPAENVRVWWGKSFTIEFWIYGNAWQQEITNTAPVIIGNMNPSGTENYWSFGPLTNGTVRWYYFNGSGQNITTTTALSTGQWYHLAFVNNAGSIAIYINGTSSASGTVSGTPQSSSSFPISIGSSNGVSFNGYLDDLRITSGVARYTTNFTPPTTPFITS